MTNSEKYEKVFVETFNVGSEVLNGTFTFKDVPQWDSVSHLSLITALEDEFDIMFDAQDILHYESYENGIRILKRYGISFDE